MRFLYFKHCCSWIVSHSSVFGCVCRGRASWIQKRRSLCRERNTRSPPHPHGACARTQKTQSSHMKRLWWPRPSTHWSLASTHTPTTNTHVRAYTHTHTLGTFEVFPACSQAQSGGGGFSFSFLFCFIIFFYLLFVSCKPRDIGEYRGGSIWVLYQHCPARGRQLIIAFHIAAADVAGVCGCRVSPEKARQLLESDAKTKPKTKSNANLLIRPQFWIETIASRRPQS